MAHTNRDSGFRRPLGDLIEKGHRIGIDLLEFVPRAEPSHATAEKGGLMSSNNVCKVPFTGGSASMRGNNRDRDNMVFTEHMTSLSGQHTQLTRWT